jgi:hypothetical protein
MNFWSHKRQGISCIGGEQSVPMRDVRKLKLVRLVCLMVGWLDGL